MPSGALLLLLAVPLLAGRRCADESPSEHAIARVEWGRTASTASPAAAAAADAADSVRCYAERHGYALLVVVLLGIIFTTDWRQQAADARARSEVDTPAAEEEAAQ